jgi:hypothetical protein
VYGLARIDASGRICERAITAPGWADGDRLTLTAEAGVVTARRDSTRRRQRAEAALAQAAATGEDITVSSVARRAGVNRTFFYRHRDLLERIHVQQAQPPPATAGGPAVSRASLQADLANANARCARLAAHVRQLEKRLSQTSGAQAWHESGLGAPADIDQLNARITELEQQNTSLRLEREEKADELQAARAANRELTRQLNVGAP